MPAPEPHLSLVVPVYNGAHFIADSLRTIVSELEALERPFEVIVVSDGSLDATVDAARRVAHPAIRVVRYPMHQGKGFALAFGSGEARGRLIGWLDADLDIDAAVIARAVRRFETEPVDAVIGSKRHPESDVHYPRIRRVYSWGYQLLVRALFRVKARDTQVGAKVFRREMLDTVVPLLLIKRYAFDLEVLAVGAGFGFDRVAEVPIRLDYRFSGTGINWKAVRLMFTDTLAIAYRIHIRHWYARRFAALQRQRLEAMPEPAAVGSETVAL
jgi:glycosyltransferase involved in cell wall biosynthesis